MADRPSPFVVLASVAVGSVAGGAYWCWARWRDFVENVLTAPTARVTVDRDRVRSRRRRRRGEPASTRSQHR